MKITYRKLDLIMNENVFYVEEVQGGNLVVTSEFREVLNSIPQYVQQAEQLLQLDIANVDEAAVEQNLNELKDIQRFEKDIKEGRKNISRYFDDVKKHALSQLDEALEMAQYPKLIEADKAIKQLKKDVLENRKMERWNELYPVFVSKVEQYKDIFEYVQGLKDFTRFQLLFPKLVSGSKSGKITNKHVTQINDIMFEWYNQVLEIRSNPFNLSNLNVFQALKEFEISPIEKTPLEIMKDLKEFQDAENERKRQNNLETNKILEAKKQEQTPKEQSFFDYQNEHEAVDYNKFGWLVNYIRANPIYNSIHGNEKLKCRLLFEMYNQLAVQDSFFQKATKNDPTTVLAVNQYIMDL